MNQIRYSEIRGVFSDRNYQDETLSGRKKAFPKTKVTRGLTLKKSEISRNIQILSM
jgi:hypothetical protein